MKNANAAITESFRNKFRRTPSIRFVKIFITDLQNKAVPRATSVYFTRTKLALSLPSFHRFLAPGLQIEKKRRTARVPKISVSAPRTAATTNRLRRTPTTKSSSLWGEVNANGSGTSGPLSACQGKRVAMCAENDRFKTTAGGTQRQLLYRPLCRPLNRCVVYR